MIYSSYSKQNEDERDSLNIEKKKRTLFYSTSKEEKKVFSLSLYKAIHNDLNYVLCTLIEEEAFSCRSRQRLKSVIQIETAKWKRE
jgi:hypothetical protein